LNLNLERFPILLVRRIFNGDGVITIANLAAFLHFALALFPNVFKSGRGSWVTYLAMSSCNKQLG
jgi:hypothetical protein